MTTPPSSPVPAPEDTMDAWLASDSMDTNALRAEVSRLRSQVERMTAERPIKRFEIEWLRNVVVVLDSKGQTKALAANMHERVESWVRRLSSDSETGDTPK